MPLAALKQRCGPVHLTHGGVQVLRPIGDHEQARLDLQTTLDELAEKRLETLRFRRCLHKAEEDLFAVIVTPTAATISSSANVLPSRSSATRS